jgi:hypothetical protein
MQQYEKALQQIGFGYVIMPSGRMRAMYNYEMINLAREACEQLGIGYSNGACKPFQPTANALAAFAGIAKEKVSTA